jgi:hypothetical protein
MMDKPPLFFLIWFAVLTAMFSYRLYRIWFRTDDEYENIVQQINRLPSWYPMKEYSIMSIQDKELWVSNAKILSAPAFVIMIIADILVITAFLFGK